MGKNNKPEPEVSAPVEVEEVPQSEAELALDLHRAETDARLAELSAKNEQQVRELQEQHAAEIRSIREAISRAHDDNERKLDATVDELQRAHRRSLEIRESGATSEAARVAAAAAYNVNEKRPLSYPPTPGALEKRLISQWKRRPGTEFCSDPKCYYPLKKLLTPEQNFIAESVPFKAGRAFKGLCSWDPMHGTGELTRYGRVQLIPIPEKKDDKQ